MCVSLECIRSFRTVFVLGHSNCSTSVLSFSYIATLHNCEEDPRMTAYLFSRWVCYSPWGLFMLELVTGVAAALFRHFFNSTSRGLNVLGWWKQVSALVYQVRKSNGFFRIARFGLVVGKWRRLCSHHGYGPVEFQITGVEHDSLHIPKKKMLKKFTVKVKFNLFTYSTCYIILLKSTH